MDFTGMSVEELDDEFNRSLEAYDQKLDSYQAGTVGGPMPPTQMGPMPPTQGQMGPMPPTQTPQPQGQMGPMPPTQMPPQMPSAYTENRMEQYGMPGIFQAGESMVDDWRAKKWTENQGMQELEQLGVQQGNNHPVAPPPIQVDETENLRAGGDPQTAYNNRKAQGNTGNAASQWGLQAGKLAKMAAKMFTGGMA